MPSQPKPHKLTTQMQSNAYINSLLRQVAGPLLQAPQLV